MVYFPLERKRGEAVHAISNRSTSLRFAEAGVAAPTWQVEIVQSVEADHRSALVGGRTGYARYLGIPGRLPEDAAELEAPLVEAPTLRIRGCGADGSPTQGHRFIHQGDGSSDTTRSTRVGVRIYPMDCSSARGVSVRENRSALDTPVGLRVVAHAWIRLAKDEANHPQSPESCGHKTGPEGSQEAKKGGLKAAADYELWFADGVRFDLLPLTAYTYRRRGQPLRIPTPGKNAKVAVCGAMRWPDGPFVFSHGPKSVNTAVFVEMLLMLEARAHRTGKRIVLVLDNGSAHTSKRSTAELERVKKFIRVFWLPTYTSEQLNDIEGVWKHLKEDYFSRMLVKHREEFTDAVVELLRTMRRGRILRQMLKPRHKVTVRKNLVVPA